MVELTADLEIGNHAAAGALAFLLSAVPALILSFGVATMLLQSLPEETKEFQVWVTQFLGPINLPDATPKIFGKGFFALGTLATIAGLLFSSSLFFGTIRKTLKVIWGNPAVTPTWVDTAMGFVLELGSLVTLVAVLSVSEATRSLVYANQDELDRSVFLFMTVLVEVVPFLILWTFFFVTLRLFPLKKPEKIRTLLYSLVAVTLFLALVQVLRLAINTDQYELLYGVIANLVVVLLNVSAFFTLYFFTAAFLYVEQNFDALLFGRYYRYWGHDSPPFPDNLLFCNPKRLDALYGRVIPAGQLLFQEGDMSRTAFFIEKGQVEIVLPSGDDTGGEAVLDILGPGQIFGEIAAIMALPRNASARARTTLTVLELPPEVFGFYLKSDRYATKKIIGTLAERLKKANTRATNP